MDDGKDAYGVEEFCKRHGFSRAYLYLLWRRGEGPRFLQLGARRLISKEAGADWRRSMEQAPKAASCDNSALHRPLLELPQSLRRRLEIGMILHDIQISTQREHGFLTRSLKRFDWRSQTFWCRHYERHRNLYH